MSTPTKTVKRSEVKVGDIIHSSHGYRLLITEVQDNATVRTDERHIGFIGHLHADKSNEKRSERYPAGSTVEVEVPALSLREIDEQRADLGERAIEACRDVAAAWEHGDLPAAARECQAVSDEMDELAKQINREVGAS